MIGCYEAVADQMWAGADDAVGCSGGDEVWVGCSLSWQHDDMQVTVTEPGVQSRSVWLYGSLRNTELNH